MEVLLQEPALLVESSNSYLKQLQKISQKNTKKKIVLYNAHGSSDARHYARVNCAGVEFGPIGGGIGTDREWVDIPSLEKYFQILNDFLVTI